MFPFDSKSLPTHSRRAVLRQAAVAAPFLPRGLPSLTTAAAQPGATLEQWYWYPGHSLVFKSIAKDTGSTCTWMLVENTPLEGVPFHKHLHEDESFYVLDGLFEITVGDITVSGWSRDLSVWAAERATSVDEYRHCARLGF